MGARWLITCIRKVLDFYFVTHLKYVLLPGPHSFPSTLFSIFLFASSFPEIAPAIFPLSLFFKHFIYLSWERWEGREKERGRSIDVWEIHHLVASHTPPTRVLAHTQACALTGNRTGNPLVHRLVLNSLSHTSQGNLTTLNTISWWFLNLHPQWDISSESSSIYLTIDIATGSFKRHLKGYHTQNMDSQIKIFL